MTSSTHRWRFFRAGGFDQVRLDTGADLAHLAELDQKLWVALSCPTQGVELQAATATLIDRLGPVTDRGGEPGVNRATVERFFEEGAALQAWRQDARAAVSGLPEGARAPDAFAALPLAYVRSGASLPLSDRLNPAWTGAMQAFAAQVVQPLLGERSELSEDEWRALVARFADFEAWSAARPETPLDQLDADALSALLAGDAQARLLDLVTQDEAAAEEAALIGDVERLVRYVRDLAKLAHNFVAFTDFYTRRDKASFQAGTLYIDGRSSDLCVKVLDAGKHATLATLSGVYLAYCECSRPGEKLTIAAAVTAGDADQLMVGRNGVFYDPLGRDWDDPVVQIVAHPIRSRQACLLHY